jgi:sortase A
VYGGGPTGGEPRPPTPQFWAGRHLCSGVVRRVAAALGRALITVGVLILLFVAYQLWGTAIYASQQQNRLRHEFAAELRKTPATTTPTTNPAVTTTTEPSPPLPPSGNAVARIQIPKIGLDAIVVDGVSTDALRMGPGHYPLTPLPGQRGNSAIAGHRTTYGAWFGNIDQLSTGDEIQIRTVQGSFTYRVYQQEVVDPNDVAVLAPDPSRPATLTLTTCNPKYSASQRLVVKAELGSATPPLPPPRGLPRPTKLVDDSSLSGDSGSLIPALITGLIAAAVGGLWWLAYHRHPRYTTWIFGAIPFLVTLFFFYTYLERLLPANY